MSNEWKSSQNNRVYERPPTTVNELRKALDKLVELNPSYGEAFVHLASHSLERTIQMSITATVSVEEGKVNVQNVLEIESKGIPNTKPSKTKVEKEEEEEDWEEEEEDWEDDEE